LSLSTRSSYTWCLLTPPRTESTPVNPLCPLRKFHHFQQEPRNNDIITFCSVFLAVLITFMLVSGRSLLRLQHKRLLSTVIDTGIPFTSEQIKQKMADENVKGATTAEATRKRIVLFGGNGFVGQAMVEAALRQGIDVVSINRSGAPKHFKPPAFAPGKVEWKSGDITAPDTYKDTLPGATGAISCVGAFGSNEFMEKINGDANITAISACLNAGVPRFVYVSTVENNLPEFVLKGYFHGKRRTEEALIDAYPETGVILRPGFIHGTRDVPLPPKVLGVTNPLGDKLSLPLWAVGKPLELLFSLPPVLYARESIPGMQAILALPVSVQALARVAIAAAIGEAQVGPDRILSTKLIHKESDRLQEAPSMGNTGK